MIPLLDWPAPAQRPKCFKTCATKKLELFQDILNLAELPLVNMHFSQKFQWVLLLQDCFNIQNVISCSRQKYCFWQESFWRISKRKRKILHYAMLHFLVILCYILSCFSWHILLQGQEFWVLQLISHVLGTKIEIYYSPVTIHCYYSLSLFTRYCSCHCSLRILPI